MHGRVVLLGVALLILLAVLLWDQEPDPTADMLCLCDEARAHMAEREAARVKPVSRSRLPVYDGGRTLIPPKVSPRALARIREV